VPEGRFRTLAAAVALVLGSLLAPATALAWSPAAPIYSGVRAAPLAVAGDPAGNGVGVMTGATADAPLLLMQRDAVARTLDAADLVWIAGTPLPGGVPSFTSSTALAQGAAAAAAGGGAAAIVVRYRGGGADVLSALVRDAGEPFGEAATVVPANFARLSDPVVAVSGAGTTLIAFTATRSSGRRTAYVSRLSGNRFGRPRVISLTGATSVTTAVGPRELGMIGWTRAGRAELSTLGETGSVSPYRVLGSAASGGDIAATGATSGGLVAWEAPRGAIRMIRRGSSSSGRFGAAVTVRRANGSNVSGLAAALDPKGIAYVTWREGSGSRTRILVARAAAGRRFSLTQVAIGAGLGRPSAAGRPTGGAIVGWAASSRWQARRVPTSGGLPVQSTLSAVGTSTAVPLSRPFVSAGPGPRADMTWVQPSADGAGYDVMQANETDQ
jgi:hypothetical protein